MTDSGETCQFDSESVLREIEMEKQELNRQNEMMDVLKVELKRCSSSSRPTCPSGPVCDESPCDTTSCGSCPECGPVPTSERGACEACVAVNAYTKEAAAVAFFSVMLVVLIV